MIGLVFCARKSAEPEKTDSNLGLKNGKLLDDQKNMIETKFDVQSEQLRLDHVRNPTFWVPFVINALTLQTGLFVINNYLSVGLNYGYSSSWLNMIG